MNFILILTLIAATSLGFLRLFQKLIGLSVHPLVGLFLIYVTGFAVSLLLLLMVRPPINFDLMQKKWVIWGIMAGLMAVTTDGLGILIFYRGGNVAIFTPILSAGSIIIAGALGLLFFKEVLTPWQIFGIIFILGGLFLLLKPY